MLRSRLAAAMTVSSACVVFVAVGVFSSARHDEEAAPEAQAPGTKAARVPDRVAMPRGLVGLEIALGIGDKAPTDWEWGHQWSPTARWSTCRSSWKSGGAGRRPAAAISPSPRGSRP